MTVDVEDVLRLPPGDIGREPTAKEIERGIKAKDRKGTIVFLTYDKANNEYIWEEWDDVKLKDMDPSSVHITGKKGKYLWTDLWPELIWSKGGQSAIHDYLWMINNKLNANALAEKVNTSEVSMKKILIYGVIGIAVVIIAWGFIPH